MRATRVCPPGRLCNARVCVQVHVRARLCGRAPIARGALLAVLRRINQLTITRLIGTCPTPNPIPIPLNHARTRTCAPAYLARARIVQGRAPRASALTSSPQHFLVGWFLAGSGLCSNQLPPFWHIPAAAFASQVRRRGVGVRTTPLTRGSPIHSIPINISHVTQTLKAPSERA